MTKRQLIDEIVSVNPTAPPEFLASFSEDQLRAYLDHLRVVGTARLTGDASRYEKYFENCPTIRADGVRSRQASRPHAAAWRRARSSRRSARQAAAADDAEADTSAQPVAAGTTGASDETGGDPSFARSQEDSEGWLF